MKEIKTLLSGFESNKHLFRFCVFFLFIAVILFCFIKSLSLTNLKKIDFKNGCIEIYNGNKLEKAMLVLPANILWLNTNLPVDNNQKITISAFGEVNLAIHHLVKDAISDKELSIPWVGPTGDTSNKFPTNERDSLRSNFKILPSENYGCVLACIIPNEDVKNDKYPNKFHPVPKNIQFIGNRKTITNNTGKDGILFLVVNDTYCDRTEKCKQAYFGKQNIDKIPSPEIDTLNNRWKFIMDKSYYNVWFDDNIGEFTIQVEYE